MQKRVLAPSAAPRALDPKLHAAGDGQGRPVALLLTEGQRSDHHGVALLLPIMPAARELLGGRGYDSIWFRKASAKRGIASCILGAVKQAAAALRPNALPPAPPHRKRALHARPRQLREDVKETRFARSTLSAISIQTTSSESTSWRRPPTWCAPRPILKKLTLLHHGAVQPLQDRHLLRALRAFGPSAVDLIVGTIKGARFSGYVVDMLDLARKLSDMVFLDNLPVHKVAGRRDAI